MQPKKLFSAKSAESVSCRFCSCWSGVFLCIIVTVVHQTMTSILSRMELFLPVQHQPQQSTASWLQAPPVSMSLPSADTDVVDSASDSPGDLRRTVDGPSVFEGVRARPFSKWNQSAMPCAPAEADWRLRQQDASTNGFIFVKPFKTGSSTASGVNLLMARNVARRLTNETGLFNHSSLGTSPRDFNMCKARSDHVWASSKYGNLDPTQSFLWTILRDPDSRIVSQFFHFEVSRNKVEPTDANFADYLTNGPQSMMHDYYLASLSLKYYQIDRDDPVAAANAIMSRYNFVGVTERMDESFVAMAMLLGLPMADIMYLTAKSRGGFDDGGRASDSGAPKPVSCTYIWPSFVSEGMQTLLDSDEWKNKSRWDRALHSAASRSLDLTIDSLGRPSFERHLSLYRQALLRSQEECLRKTVFPCSSGGRFTPEEKTTCLWKDSGCGYECLDEVANELQLWDVAG